MYGDGIEVVDDLPARTLREKLLGEEWGERCERELPNRKPFWEGADHMMHGHEVWEQLGGPGV